MNFFSDFFFQFKRNVVWGELKWQIDDIFFKEGSLKSQYGSIWAGEGSKIAKNCRCRLWTAPKYVVLLSMCVSNSFRRNVESIFNPEISVQKCENEMFEHETPWKKIWNMPVLEHAWLDREVKSICCRLAVDNLWGQPIKLIQVVSTMRTNLLNWCNLVSISKNVMFYVFLVVRIY